MSERLEMLDLFNVRDTFVAGLGAIESIGGGCYRFTFYSAQGSELIVAAKIIIPADALASAMTMTARTTHTCACENVRNMARN